MYVCKYCGFISHDEKINYCNNTKCRFYGYGNNMSYGYDMPYNFCNFAGGQADFNRAKDGNAQKNFGFCGCNRADNGCNQDVGKNDFCNKDACGMNYSGRNDGNDGNGGGCGALNCETGKSEKARDCYPMPDMRGCSMLGFATVPFQKLETLFPLKESLYAGTVFPELNMPYDKKIIRRG